MKTIVSFVSSFFPLTVLSLIFVSCGPDDVKATPVKTFYSDASFDGAIINSSRCKAMWNIFSGDESKWADYRPKLVIKHHHEK